jgi:hypothetical protein
MSAIKTFAECGGNGGAVSCALTACKTPLGVEHAEYFTFFGDSYSLVHNWGLLNMRLLTITWHFIKPSAHSLSEY